MAAAIRLSRRNSGRTATNPSVGTILVNSEDEIVGRGVTALGGRPHAETVAIQDAGGSAEGCTAYVTLEPCAHHGRTPPCAEALVSAGVRRVVGGASDPDPRVSGKGYAILRDAGVEVVEGVMGDEAADAVAGYLIRSFRKRPEVILKLAVSADDMIGRRGEGQVAITGAEARVRAHLLRADAHCILVGGGTALADDPELTCRLPGLETRSPVRIVVGGSSKLKSDSNLVETARSIPTWLAPSGEISNAERARMDAAGVTMLATEGHNGHVALPELMEDLAAQGIMSVLVEGGAEIARSFVAEGLVDRIVLFRAPMIIGDDGIASPLDPMRLGFDLMREEMLGDDRCLEFVRKGRF